MEVHLFKNSDYSSAHKISLMDLIGPLIEFDSIFITFWSSYSQILTIYSLKSSVFQ